MTADEARKVKKGFASSYEQKYWLGEILILYDKILRLYHTQRFSPQIPTE